MTRQLIKEGIYWGLAYSFTGLVPDHHSRERDPGAETSDLTAKLKAARGRLALTRAFET